MVAKCDSSSVVQRKLTSSSGLSASLPCIGPSKLVSMMDIDGTSVIGVYFHLNTISLHTIYINQRAMSIHRHCEYASYRLYSMHASCSNSFELDDSLISRDFIPILRCFHSFPGKRWKRT